MVDSSTPIQKRNIAYKLRIGNIQSGKPILENERLRHMEIEGKPVVRVNVIANIVDKFVQEGEKKFGSITIDDGSGQIKGKVFGEDVEKLSLLNQGDTIMLIGLLRSWNNEVYITPEIMKKKEPSFLLIRKLEVESSQPKTLDRGKIAELKDKIVTMVKQAEDGGGIDIDKIILELKEPPEVINKEIQRLLEDGIAYEPRPGKLRYLG
jgi:RPA family protein